MAYGTFTTTDCMYATTAVVNASPYTMHVRFLDTLANATQKYLFALCRPGSNAVWAGIDIQSGTARFTTNSATGRVTSSNTYSAGGWNNVTGVHSSNTLRSIILNGTQMNNTANTAGVANVPTLAIGARVGAANQLPALGCQIAEASLWDLALTAEEIAALQSGVSALSIRPGSLKHYFPLIRETIDMMAAPLTVVGSPTVEPHCRTFL